MPERSEQKQPADAGPVERMVRRAGELTLDEVEYPRDLFSALIDGNSPSHCLEPPK